MRESNFAFPTQNKACVCITSQLYDRRALDTSSPLPLLNSLTHLTYLTSTSPRIREIMTMDGGLERLVKILHDFCMCPPPPENSAILYGLLPPSVRPQKPSPTLNPTNFDKQAAYRFSLAFQCVVNIGVRGSEPIRSRVVQAGTLDVVGCILEAWLGNKGFAVGPSSSATGLPRETREQRQARRDAALALRQRDHREQAAAELERLRRGVPPQGGVRPPTLRLPGHFEEDDSMDVTHTSVEESNLHDALLLLSASATAPGHNAGGVTSESDNEMSTDNSAAPTPVGSSTPTGSVVVSSRDRSGTVIARPVWDAPRPTTSNSRASPSSPESSSRPETETEDDGEHEIDADGDVDMDGHSHASATARQHRRRAVGIVSDDTSSADTHIIINDSAAEGHGLEDGIVSLEANDDFAMGAPPGAPGAIVGIGAGSGESEGEDTTGTTTGTETETEQDAADRVPRAPDETPRPGVVPLPPSERTPQPQQMQPQVTLVSTAGASNQRGHRHHHHHREQGPYRDEDVLLSLQLLAYLSKYPHVRQAFYKPRSTFHPASVNTASGRWGARNGERDMETVSGPSVKVRPGKEKEGVIPPRKEKEKELGLLRSFAVGLRGKERELAKDNDSKEPTTSSSTSNNMTSAKQLPRQTNVFSLVERFTFKPSSTETDLPSPPPRLPTEIQYWAGVVMRNACRKDDSRGGIRQCANMLCGRWERYPREFAKCRRCRKAKYCGKECQSTAWSEGHRFWCSAKDDDETPAAAAAAAAAAAGNAGQGPDQSRRERRERVREVERERRQNERAVPAIHPPPTSHPGTIGDGLRGPGAGGTPRANAGVPGGSSVTPRAVVWPEARPPPTHRYLGRTNPMSYVNPVQQPAIPVQPIQRPPIQSPSGTSGANGSATRTPTRNYFPSTDGFSDPSVSGRRRAETVTGATIVGGGLRGADSRFGSMVQPGALYPQGLNHGHGRSPLRPPYVPNSGSNSSPVQPPAQSQYVPPHTQTPVRNRAIWSQEVSGLGPEVGSVDFSPMEENDMVLG